jgi:hypothetical protein
MSVMLQGASHGGTEVCWRLLGATLSSPALICPTSAPPAVLIKGGVWKNTEDEILKAAVMK